MLRGGWERVAVFLGEYQHSLDAKGRVILPAKFRAQLESGCVLTRGRERCVVVFPRDEFMRLAEELKSVPKSSAQVRNAARVVFGSASEQVPDAQGRVLVPDHLRSYATLDRDLVIRGSGNYFEIWDRETGASALESAQSQFSELTEEQHIDLPF